MLLVPRLFLSVLLKHLFLLLFIVLVPISTTARDTDKNTCDITISNTQCRIINVFDINGNLLTTMESGSFGLVPVEVTPMWTDPTPLGIGEERIYVFKEGNFELGRTIATCTSPEITTNNSFTRACNDGLLIDTYTNIGCREMEIYNTNSEVIASLSPNESIQLTVTNKIFIFIVGTDTIAIRSEIGGLIDSKGCDEGCICIRLFDPVCGVDGNTYGNACEAACAGVDVAFNGLCADAVAQPCHDLSGIDFGFCAAVMGIAVVNGTCTYVSGCGDFVVDGINYTDAFFPSVEICAQSCATKSCICPAVIDPVCGSDGKTYSNSCEAECVGVTWTQGTCVTGACETVITHSATATVTGVYKATNTILSAATIPSNVTASYEAGQSITLSAGFKALNGSQFTASIRTCTSSNDLQEKTIVSHKQVSATLPIASLEKIQLTVFPNPFQQASNVQFYIPADSPAEIQVFNVHQQSVLQKTMTVQQGWHAMPLDMGKFSHGLYYLVVRTPEDFVVQELVRL